jgi:hypothetical protein
MDTEEEEPKQKRQKTSWMSELLGYLEANENPNHGYRNDSNDRRLYDLLTKFLSCTEAEVEAIDRSFVEEIFRILDEYTNWDGGFVLKFGQEKSRPYEVDDREEDPHPPLLPLLTRFLERPPRNAEQIEIWPHVGEFYCSFPEQINIDATDRNCKLKYFRIYDLDETWDEDEEDLRLSIHRKSVEEILFSCRAIESLALYGEGYQLWRRSDSPGPRPFESQTKRLDLGQLETRIADDEPLFHRDTKFDRLEHLSIQTNKEHQTIDVGSFWRSWFGRTWRTLKNLEVHFNVTGDSMAGMFNRSFAFMCMEASHSNHPDAFRSFISIQNISFTLPLLDRDTSGDLQYNNFLRQYFASAPSSLKVLSIRNKKPSHCDEDNEDATSSFARLL